MTDADFNTFLGTLSGTALSALPPDAQVLSTMGITPAKLGAYDFKTRFPGVPARIWPLVWPLPARGQGGWRTVGDVRKTLNDFGL